MNLTIHFNWPPACDSARVILGTPSTNDVGIDFRVGVIPHDETDKIYWAKPGWFAGELQEELTFDVKRDDKLVVERKTTGSDKIATRNIWDINKEWPVTAHGESMTVVPWYF